VTTRWSRLSDLLRDELAARERAVAEFFDANQDRLARACHEMARAFARGGILIPYGRAAAATDAAHVAVEFMHPVIVGKRALPAVSPASDPTGIASATVLARAGDIALALGHEAVTPELRKFLDEARRRGLLTIAMTAGDEVAGCDFAFAVPAADARVVQEVQETAYHMLWELVHVFFEHPGLLDDACITCGDVAVEATVVSVSGSSAVIEKERAREEVAIDLVPEVAVGDTVLCHAGVALERLERTSVVTTATEATSFLYPFLEREERDLDQVLHDVRESITQKASDVTAMRRLIDIEAIEACGLAVRAQLERGARLIAFGNGGSSTDAQDMAADFADAGWPALALNNDVATITAVGNDVGYDNVFSRQLIALARPGDIAVAISTSGSSRNVIAALDEARRREMLTIGIAGYDGGAMAKMDRLDHLFQAHGDYVPRLQEVHATIYHLLVGAVGSR
jgi:D-sedoheptulose 7-phosphate isomerase